jgi:hypothetical protein
MQKYIQGIIDNVYGCGILTYKQKFNKKYGFNKNDSHSIKKISKLTKYKKEGLETIFNKGVGAYHTNPESVRPRVHSPEQWAMARVYASINPSSKASKVDKSHLIIGGAINFHKIHWGTFTKQFHNRKNKKLKNLKEFANYILKNENDFNTITKKRANFYKHVISGGMIGYGPKKEKESTQEFLDSLKKRKAERDFLLNNPNPDIIPDLNIITNTTNEVSEVENTDDKKEEVHYGSLDDNTIENIIIPHEEIDNTIKDIEEVLPENNQDNIYQEINNVKQEIQELNIENEKNYEEIEKLNKKDRTYIARKDFFNRKISNNISKITDLEELEDELLEKQIQNLENNLSKEKNKFEDIMKTYEELDLGFIEFTDENLVELPNDIINDGTIYLKTISISDKIAKENILNYYENNIEETELHKKLTGAGNIFEWTSVGENNNIFSKICGVGDNDVLLSDNVIEELFKQCKANILENNPELTSEDLDFLKSASSQFPQDLIDILNNIVNERKDYNKDFLKLYNEQIKKMNEVYEEVKDKIPIKDFKKWYYKKFDYEGIEIQIAKFNKPDFDSIKDNWANSKTEIEEAYKKGAPLYLTNIDKKRYITGWEKTFKFDAKVKNKIEKEIRDLFVNEMNQVLYDTFSKDNQKYKYIITSNFKECVANYNFTDDKKIKKHILEIYKLKDSYGGNKAVSIPITEFRPIQSTIKETTNIMIELLEKQLKNKKEEKKKANTKNNQEYIERINNYIPFLEKTILDNEKKLNLSIKEKDKEKYEKIIQSKKEWLEDARNDLIKVMNDKNIGDKNRKTRYKNYNKKSK